MFSSKIQDIKKNTQLVADDIADKAKIVASEVIDDTREAAGKVAAWTGAREDEIASVVRDSRRNTRKMVYQKPFISLAIAVGVGALVTYWFTRRPATQTEQ